MMNSLDHIITELLGERHTAKDPLARQRLAEMYGYDGDVMAAEGRHAQAIPSYLRHLEINPQDFRRNMALGSSYFQLYCLPEAEAACDAALRVKPQDAHAHIQRAVVRFARGNWQGGLADMEYRHNPAWARSVNWSVTPRDLRQLHPFTASAADQGQPVLVHAEGGAGDTVQFAALLAALRPHTGRIVFEVQKPLLALMKGLEQEGVSVIARGDELPYPVTRQIALLSLLRVFSINPFGLNPFSAAYELPVASTLVAQARAKLDAAFGAGPRIGLAWRGDPNNRFDLGRDVPVELMRPFTEIDGVTAICLLDDTTAAEREALPNLRHLAASGERASFIDMASAMKGMDLIVSSDTVWPNLAAALRLPTLLLLKHMPNWRWGLEGEATPLAPTTRLLRQSEPGNWATPLAQALEATRQLRVG